MPLALPARLELTTLRLGGARSIQVSYGSRKYGIILPNFMGAVKLGGEFSWLIFKISPLQIY